MEKTTDNRFEDLLDIFFSAPDKNGAHGYPPGRFFEFVRALAESANDLKKCALLLNAAEREFPDDGFFRNLCGAVFDAMVDFGVLPEELTCEEKSEKAVFLLKNALELFGKLSDICYAASREEVSLPDVAVKMAEKFRVSSVQDIAELLISSDPFADKRVFRWNGRVLTAVTPDAVKPIGKFFGFAGVRHIFTDHFKDFADSKCNVPLLIYSLPGYGKTSMTLSHALAVKKSVVILPDPEDLNGSWIELVVRLARRKDHKFVVFFDDIDPSQVDWYSFRTHVGGAFSMPENVMPVLSSNYEFPAGILSRGRKVSYPVFDEVRCTEMIEDFLLDFGLKRPMPQLISLIGADYTEEFGQKKFTELSPRTLMRYLQIYMQDKNKRRTMVEMAMGELVTRPDAELFYEFNINLMRDLYGEEYINRLRNEKLKNL